MQSTIELGWKFLWTWLVHIKTIHRDFFLFTTLYVLPPKITSITSNRSLGYFTDLFYSWGISVFPWQLQTIWYCYWDQYEYNGCLLLFCSAHDVILREPSPDSWEPVWWINARNELLLAFPVIHRGMLSTFHKLIRDFVLEFKTSVSLAR